MQRIENGGLIVGCDFCRTDWDGVAPVIEGHRGSIICLSCLKLALKDLHAGAEPFNCVLCLREKIPASVQRWSHQDNSSALVCQGCVLQAADVFDRDPDVGWTWEKRPGP